MLAAAFKAGSAACTQGLTWCSSMTRVVTTAWIHGVPTVGIHGITARIYTVCVARVHGVHVLRHGVLLHSLLRWRVVLHGGTTSRQVNRAHTAS
jgi:hypothetical protein